MSTPEHNLRIDYIEFPVKDLPATKQFYNSLLGWSFDDYGPDYIAFNDGRISGGFYTSPTTEVGPALVVIYTTDLEKMKEKVQQSGGTITKDTFDFPGGRRFHFQDPSGCELAMWSNT